MKIAIYGGSFNPIHNGHINLAKYAINKLKLDKVIFVPAYKSPHKKKEIYENAIDRMNMIDLSLEDKMFMSKFEIKRKGVSYTIDTIEYFKNKYKHDELFLLIGTDQLYKLHKWRKIEDISKKVKIVIFKRNENFSKINIKRYNALLLDNPIFKESSTKFKEGDFSMINNDVNKYIGKNLLYINELLSRQIKPEKSKRAADRLKHCHSAGRFAAKLAKKVGVNPRDAWVAATFHDITKMWTNEEHEIFLDEFGINKNISSYKYHSLTASIWLEKKYLIDDKEICDAVKYHTSLREEMTELDKVVWAADKLCEGRRFENVQKYRENIFENFNEGFKSLVKKEYQKLIDILDDNSKEIYKKLMGG